MYCKKCGTQLAENVLFCSRCGARQDVGQPRENTQQGVYQQPTGQQQVAPQQNVYQQQAGQQQAAPPQQNVYQQQAAYAGQQPMYTEQQQMYAGQQAAYQQQAAASQQNVYQQATPLQGINPQPIYPQSTGATMQMGAQGANMAGAAMQMGAQGANMAGAAIQMGAQGAGMAGAAVRAGAGAARRAVHTKLLLLIAVALLAIAGMLYYFFFRSGTPEDTIAKLEQAMNDMDQTALMECFDGQMNSLYSGALGVGGDLLGIDLEALADLSSGLGGIMSAAGLTPKVEIEVVEVSYSSSKENCVVDVVIRMTYQGETSEEEVQLPMKKDGREWLISLSGLSELEIY